METGDYLNLNGKILKKGKALIFPDNHSFRYGDGCFETIRMNRGVMMLESYHFERLFSSLDKMQFTLPEYFTPDYLKTQILELWRKNAGGKMTRVRLTVFRGNGGLYDVENHFPNFLIQTWPLEQATGQLNENGLITDLYRDAQKICDQFSMIKSNNYLCYVMAAIWAKKNKLNDAFLLNPEHRISDSTIANIFMLKDGCIFTPSLQEGCVGGTMRRYLLTSFRRENMPVQESTIEPGALFQASEIFLTNAITGIRWVKQVGSNHYQHHMARRLHREFIEPLFHGSNL